MTYHGLTGTRGTLAGMRPRHRRAVAALAGLFAAGLTVGWLA